MKLNKKNFINTINDNYFFEKFPKIAVGVSGGPDSMALVYLLSQFITFKKGSLIAIIFDHKIREESLYESKKIKNYLNKLNITAKIISASNEKVKKNNMNEARINRFDGLIKFCKKNKILHLFLGHHYNDNLETFLTRRVSGSNLEGLSCMKNLSIRNNIHVLRPLLTFTKKNILNYNRINNIFYIVDPSNFDLKFTRAVIRKFIESSDQEKYIKKDFKKINHEVFFFKKMIWETFHLLLNKINNKKIEINYFKFISKNNYILEHQIQIIYKFFLRKKTGIRSSKIQNFIKILKLKSFKHYNIGSLIIEKRGNLLTFYGK